MTNSCDISTFLSADIKINTYPVYTVITVVDNGNHKSSIQKFMDCDVECYSEYLLNLALGAFCDIKIVKLLQLRIAVISDSSVLKIQISTTEILDKILYFTHK